MAEPLVFAPQGWPKLPEQTAFPEVASWCYENIQQPDGPDVGEPWTFTDSQALFLSYWYAFDDDLRWVYRRGTLRLMKGAGKDPVAAVLALAELLGPSRFDKRKELLVPNPTAWVDVAAVSKDQTRTTMRLVPALLSKETVARYGVDLGKEIVYARDGASVIQAVTSSPHSLEGGRSSLAIRNETQYWFKANDGHAMAEVIDGNLAKSRDGAARALSFCNAHVPGEDSVAEREWDAWQLIQQGGTRLDDDVLYYAREAPPDTKLEDRESLRAGIDAAKGDSFWLDTERLIAEVYDPRTTPSEARRKYLNQVVAAEDAYFAPEEWRSCEVEETLEDGEQITLGFDGSESDDHSGLVATRVSDGCEFVLGHWDPERFGGEIPRDVVDAEVKHAKETYDVVAFYSDLHPFESYVDEWQREFGLEVSRFRGLCVAASGKHMIAWDMRARTKEFTRAAERLHAEVVAGTFKFAPHGALTQHALNARNRMGNGGMSFGKETRNSKRKVDLLAATTLSRLAWHDYEALPRNKKRRKRTGKAMFA